MRQACSGMYAGKNTSIDGTSFFLTQWYSTLAPKDERLLLCTRSQSLIISGSMMRLGKSLVFW